MKEDAKEVQKYRYNDLYERNKRMSRFYLPTSCFMFGLMMLYLWMKLLAQSTQDITTGYAVFNSVLIVAFVIANFVVFKKQKTGHTLCRFVLLEIAVEVLIVGIKTDADFIFIIMLFYDCIHTSIYIKLLLIYLRFSILKSVFVFVFFAFGIV
jgi:multidrug transporter EmrE-like cation transporter